MTGVGVTQTVDGVALSLLSLERYREGVIALFRMRRRRGPFEREFSSPHLAITVLPAGPMPHSVWLMSAGGGGGMRELEFRMSYAIVPAPVADAGVIVIEVGEISWAHHRQGTRKVVSVDNGPWRFTIPLPAAPV